MLAAMVLLVISMWLLGRKRQAWFALLPAAFMTVTTLGALGWLFFTKYLPEGSYSLMIADVVLVILAAAMIVMSIHAFATKRYAKTEAAATPM